MKGYHNLSPTIGYTSKIDDIEHHDPQQHSKHRKPSS
jgi:hypothetical protein